MNQLNEQFSQLQLGSKTGFVYSLETNKHGLKNLKKHVENPTRLESIVERLTSTVIKKLPDKSVVEVINDIPECNQKVIELVHKKSYIQYLEDLFEPLEGQKPKESIWIELDTYLTPQTFSSARIAVQATLTAIDNVMTNRWINSFVAIRPPGHHVSALQNKPQGFCIFNNVAIGARYLRQKYGTQKILIFDWDVHHGNGTQDTFIDDKNTLFVSIHIYNNGQYYPSTGNPKSVGADFTNINIGWNQKDDPITTGDYVYAFERVLSPIIKQFAPEVILISAGYDAATGDPIGQIELSPEGFAYMTYSLQQICPKIVAVLEGGYNNDSIADASEATFRVLLGEQLNFKEIQRNSKPNSSGIEAVKTSVALLSMYWKVLEDKSLVDYENSILGVETQIITGGHKQGFRVEGDKLLKSAKENERIFYEDLNNQDSQYRNENIYLIENKLIPKFFGMKENYIIMENLMIGAELGSVIDVKLGKKTYDIRTKQDKREAEAKKAILTTQNKFGFRLAGVKLKNKSGEITKNLNGSAIYNNVKTRQDLLDNLIAVLKSNESKQINIQALKASLDLIDQMIFFIKNVSKRYFRASSFLLIVDNINQKFNCKWIDFNYCAPLEVDTESPDSKFDENIVFGLEKLKKLFLEIQKQH